MKILVVDDDNIIRMGLTKMIERISDENEVAGGFQNGKAALEYLKKHDDIDLVMTDIKMPIMTGVELVQEAQKQLQNPPVFIAVSGYDEFTYVRDVMKSGAFTYLLKPIKKEELKKILEEVSKQINETKNKTNIFEKSLDILKRDFFKNLLFSSKEIDKNNWEVLFSNTGLDKKFCFRLVVMDKKQELNVYNDFMKNINTYFPEVENTSYEFKNLVFIILYVNLGLGYNLNKFKKLVEKEADKIVEQKFNVYLLEPTYDIWKLRDESSLVIKLHESKNEKEKNDFRVHTLRDEEELKEVLETKSENSANSVITLAKEYIIKNFNKNISLKTVADEVYLSQNYLSELFRKETGEGFYDFLSKYRIKKAQEILLTTNLKVYEIAPKVGYNDSITFGRAFKKITGTTPNNFRNKKC